MSYEEEDTCLTGDEHGVGRLGAGRQLLAPPPRGRRSQREEMHRAEIGVSSNISNTLATR